MIYKEVNYDLAIEECANLMRTRPLMGDQVESARAYRNGLRAEKDMAYHLKVHFGGRRDMAVFNDLSVAHREVTAQIDHLVLTRWSAYFIETKSAAQGVHINEDGQWSRRYGRRLRHFESPITQNQRHEVILFDLLEARRDEFMGKVLGLQKTFRNTVDVRHLVAVSSKARIEGPGKKDVAEHLRPLDQIPQLIVERHKAVKSSLLGSAWAEVFDRGSRKRDPAFSEKEFEACCRMLLAVDRGLTPLEQVHACIGAPPAETTAPTARPDEADADAPGVAPETAPPRCPRCGSPMVLRSARRGKRAGGRFYGCTNYPRCRGIVNID